MTNQFFVSSNFLLFVEFIDAPLFAVSAIAEQKKKETANIRKEREVAAGDEDYYGPALPPNFGTFNIQGTHTCYTAALQPLALWRDGTKGSCLIRRGAIVHKRLSLTRIFSPCPKRLYCTL